LKSNLNRAQIKRSLNLTHTTRVLKHWNF